MRSKDLPAHPASEVFPMMVGDEFDELVASIKRNGLLHPIVLDDKKQILDGRNRQKACKVARVKPVFVPYEGKDYVSYIVACNLHRRQLTSGQKATIGAKLLPQYEAEGKRRKVEGGRKGKPGTKKKDEKNCSHLSKGEAREPQSAEKAAKDVGVSSGSIKKAKKLRTEAPELAEKVESGETTLNAATKELKKRKAVEEAEGRVNWEKEFREMKAKTNGLMRKYQKIDEESEAVIRMLLDYEEGSKDKEGTDKLFSLVRAKLSLIGNRMVEKAAMLKGE